MKQAIGITLILVLVIFNSCKEKDNGDNSVTRPNILLIIADDMSKDACPG